MYIAASVAWMFAEGQVPDQWAVMGVLACLGGAAVIYFGPRGSGGAESAVVIVREANRNLQMRAIRQHRLYDGRVLACREYGDARGWPVLCHHGGLLCGRDVETADDTAKALGLRLISPNRPGIGLSAIVEGRDTADWADDAEVLADLLGLERFGVMGWSMGGQYALACAAILRSRVTAAVILAGAMPVDDEATFTEMNEGDRHFTQMSRHHPSRARAVFRTLRWIARLSPWAFGRIASNQLGVADGGVIRRISARRLAQWYLEASRNLDGLVEEYVAWARPWGFSLGDIPSRVTVFRGEEDSLVPRAWASRMASSVRKGKFLPVAGGGHLFAQLEWRRVLEPLVPVK